MEGSVEAHHVLVEFTYVDMFPQGHPPRNPFQLRTLPVALPVEGCLASLLRDAPVKWLHVPRLKHMFEGYRVAGTFGLSNLSAIFRGPN